MWELDYKESWAPKNWCFWTVVLEKTLESPLDCKEMQPVHPKLNQSWIFIGRTDAKAETPIFWPPDVKNWLIWKDPDAGKDWGQEEKGMTEDEIVGCHHWLNGHGFGWTPKLGDGQGGLVCCRSWGRKESDMTEWTELNWTDVEVPILWPPDAKNWFIWKEPDIEKDWRQEEEMTEDKMVRWHHWFMVHEFEQTLGDSGGQGSLTWCSLLGCKQSDTT